MSFPSWEDLESLIALTLCDEDDPSRLTWKELKDSWGAHYTGPCCNFMRSYGLDPWKDEDCQEALDISKALKEMHNEDNEEVVLRPDGLKDIKPGHDAIDIASTNRMDAGVLKELKVEGNDDDIPWERAHQLNPNEKVQHAKILKEEGTNYFKLNINEFEKAAAKYQNVVDFLSIDGEDEESYGPDKEERKDDLQSCQLNLSMCYIKLGKLTEAKDTCTKVIEAKDNIVKAWFRRGGANFGLQDFENAKADFEETLKLEPKNKAAKNKLVLCQQAVKSGKEKKKIMVSDIFKRMGDNLLGEHLEGMTVPAEELRARKAWQGLKINRCTKISDSVRKISSGRYKAVVVVDLSQNQELFEQELGGVLQSFVQAGGSVAFPTSDGFHLAATLRTLFNTTWERSNYYRSMWDVSRKNSDTVTEFFGDVSQMRDLPFSAKVASVKNVPGHEQCFRIVSGARTQSLIPLMAGGDVDAEDVCVAVHKYGSGSVAFFGDVNCETETVQLVAAYIRNRVDGPSN